MLLVTGLAAVTATGIVSMRFRHRNQDSSTELEEITAEIQQHVRDIASWFHPTPTPIDGMDRPLPPGESL